MSYLSDEKASAIAADLDVDKAMIEGWYEAFELFDKNKDGHINSDELIHMLRQLKQDPTDAEVKTIIEELDEDKSGQIDFVEFCKHMKSKYKSPGDKEEEIKQAFKVFDADNNNFISADELKHLMQTLGDPLTDEEALEMIRVADVNQDGKIDYDEFAKMMYAS